MITVFFAYVLPLVHVLACIFLIVVVLLQTGKGAEMGAVLGGGSQTLFGASGAGNLLTKLTTGMAITFMATSLLIVIGQRNRPTSSILDRLPDTPPAAPDAATNVPAVPAPQADAAPAAEAAPTAPAAPEPAADAKPEDAPAAAAVPAPAEVPPAASAPAAP